MGYFQRVRGRSDLAIGDDTTTSNPTTDPTFVAPATLTCSDGITLVSDLSLCPAAPVAPGAGAQQTCPDGVTLVTDLSTCPGAQGTIADPVDPTAADVVGLNDPNANSFKLVGNICKPLTYASLASGQDLQRQLNRMAKVKSLPLISIDGAIGPGTVSLFATVTGNAQTCSAIGASCVAFTQTVQLQADLVGAPTFVPAPSPSAPLSLATASGKVVKAPLSTTAASILDTVGLGTLSTAEQLGLAALGIGIIYFIGKGAKKVPMKKSTTRRYR